MAYSTIIEKYGICIDCEKQGDSSFKPIISDRCKSFHYNKYRREISSKKQQARQQAMRVKYLPENKKMLEEKGLIEDENLVLYFKLAAIELAKSPRCENCGEFISEQYYRAATAHILMKSKFYSVRAHPKNKLFLGAGCGCHNESHRWDTFSKMQIWPIAVRNFKEIYPFIDDAEKKNIPAILWKEIPDEYKKYYGHNFVENIHLLPNN